MKRMLPFLALSWLLGICLVRTTSAISVDPSGGFLLSQPQSRNTSGGGATGIPPGTRGRTTPVQSGSSGSGGQP
jgi:hypothetical protein